MSRIFFVYLIFVVLLSCKDKDPGLKSPAGSWAYATPENGIDVTFDVVASSSGFDVQNQTIKVDGVDARAEKTVTAFTSTTVQNIRINANDTKVTYPYNISFTNGAVSGDFKSITFTDVTYTYPWGSTKPLSDITITRK